MPRRSRQPPCLSRSAKKVLDATLHPQVDASLKQLKSCARSLQPVLSTFTDELQILHRIYYKGKNQHRSALFWRCVAEMRRYGDRVEELSLLSLVDSLRYSFFAEESQSNSKLLKGSWTHYPDPSSVSYTHERIGASIALVRKMHERLTQAYQSFSLAMQTGAFIQLILALAGIASRMSSLVSELIPLLEQVHKAVGCILFTLHITVSVASRIAILIFSIYSRRRKYTMILVWCCPINTMEWLHQFKYPSTLMKIPAFRFCDQFLSQQFVRTIQQKLIHQSKLFNRWQKRLKPWRNELCLGANRNRKRRGDETK
ncbi:hypothetical protein B0H12DRAFT_1007421 [Mycena haematopus]|nr:hypothetical protein B0H12DRAFT_1007421 [Mycena haematopus]